MKSDDNAKGLIFLYGSKLIIVRRRVFHYLRWILVLRIECQANSPKLHDVGYIGYPTSQWSFVAIEIDTGRRNFGCARKETGATVGFQQRSVRQYAG